MNKFVSVTYMDNHISCQSFETQKEAFTAMSDAFDDNFSSELSCRVFKLAKPYILIRVERDGVKTAQFETFNAAKIEMEKELFETLHIGTFSQVNRFIRKEEAGISDDSAWCMHKSDRIDWKIYAVESC